MEDLSEKVKAPTTILVKDEPSICTTTEETERLFKLFQLFINIDKRIQKKNYETTNKRNTDNSSKAK